MLLSKPQSFGWSPSRRPAPGAPEIPPLLTVNREWAGAGPENRPTGAKSPPPVGAFACLGLKHPHITHSVDIRVSTWCGRTPAIPPACRSVTFDDQL